MSRQLAPMWSGTALALLLTLNGAFAAAQGDMAQPMPPGTMEWGSGPPTLPAGAELAVLSGNPMEAGPFVIRLRFPDGYTVPPHTHPTTENVTVISGTILFAHGEDPASAEPQDIAAGGSHTCGITQGGSILCWGWDKFGQATPPADL